MRVEVDLQREGSDVVRGDVEDGSWGGVVRKGRTAAVGRIYRRLEACLRSWRSIWSEIRKRSRDHECET